MDEKMKKVEIKNIGIKDIIRLLFILFLSFTVIYSSVSLVVSMFEKEEIISKDEIQLYRIDSNLVTNHSIYYYIEKCFKNIIEATNQNKYDDLYKLYIESYKEQYTREDVYAKLKEFSIEDCKCKLQKVYTADDIYILEYTLNENVEYMFISLNTSKNASYNFAIVK